MPVIPIPVVSNNKVALAFCAAFLFTWAPVFILLGDPYLDVFIALMAGMIVQGLLFMTFMFLGFVLEQNKT